VGPKGVLRVGRVGCGKRVQHGLVEDDRDGDGRFQRQRVRKGDGPDVPDRQNVDGERRAPTRPGRDGNGGNKRRSAEPGGAGLRLAARKTEAVLLTGNRRPGRVLSTWTEKRSFRGSLLDTWEYDSTVIRRLGPMWKGRCKGWEDGSRSWPHNAQRRGPRSSRRGLRGMFKYGRGNRNSDRGRSDTTSWVVELHPSARVHFIKTGRVYTTWRCHTIRDFLLVSKCFNCQCFGHIDSAPQQCGYCASTDHESRNCRHREDKRAHKCANCTRSGIKDANDHTAENICPIYQHRAQEAINSTQYDVDG
jgi:hypothetical protein